MPRHQEALDQASSEVSSLDRATHLRAIPPLPESPPLPPDIDEDCERAETCAAHAEAIVAKHRHKIIIENPNEREKQWESLVELRTREFELQDLHEILAKRLIADEEDAEASRALTRVIEAEKRIEQAIEDLNQLDQRLTVDEDADAWVESQENLDGDFVDGVEIAPAELGTIDDEDITEDKSGSTEGAQIPEYYEEVKDDGLTQEGDSIEGIIKEHVSVHPIRQVDGEPSVTTHEIRQVDDAPKEAIPISKTIPVGEMMEDVGLAPAVIENRSPERAEPDKALIAVPGNITETRSSYTQLNRIIPQIEADIKSFQKGDHLDNEAIDTHIIDLSHAYDSFTERLRIIQEAAHPMEDDAEEKELISDALAMISELRGELNRLDFEAYEEIRSRERMKEADYRKKEVLEGIAKDLSQLLQKSGVKHPEIQFAKPANVFASLGRLFGKQSVDIDPRSLKAIQDRIAEAQNAHLLHAFPADRNSPAFMKARDKDPLLKAIQTDDVRNLWRILHTHIASLDAKLHPEAKEDADALGKHLTDSERKLKASAEIQMLKHFVPNAEKIILAVDNHIHSDDFSFSGKDVITSMSELLSAIRSGDQIDIEQTLTKLQKQSETLLENGIHIDEIVDLVKDAERIVSEEAEKKSKPEKKIRKASKRVSSAIARKKRKDAEEEKKSKKKKPAKKRATSSSTAKRKKVTRRKKKED